MIRDKYGRIEYNSIDVVKILYQNPDIDTNSLPLSKSDLQKYQESCKLCGLESKFLPLKELDFSIEEFDTENQNDWFIPEEYKNFDISKWLNDQCKTTEELDRVKLELEKYQNFNMIFLLKLSKYLVDEFRKNQIVWGVGRGSSVASYCLYLIGLHKVDSLKYNLDINEFLK